MPLDYVIYGQNPSLAAMGKSGLCSMPANPKREPAMRYTRRLLLTLTAPLALAACQTMDRVGATIASFDLPTINHEDRVTVIPQGNCPAVSRVAELSSLYQFANPVRPSPETKLSEAHVTRVSNTCLRQGDNLRLSLSINFDAGLGPKGRINPGDKPSFAYPYFVAITNAQNQILSKEIFALNVSYDQNASTQAQLEQISQVVPLGQDDPATYRILIGFQLAPEELAYNRKLPQEELGKSLTITTKAPAQPGTF